MSLEFKGTAVIADGRLRIEDDPRYGSITALEIKGRHAEVVAAASVYRAAGYRVTVEQSPQGGYSTLLATIDSGTYGGATTNIPESDDWELDIEGDERSIFNAPNVIAAQSGWSISDIAAFRADIEKVARGEIAYDDSVWPVSSQGQIDLFNLLVTKVARGVESYRISGYVLHNTQVVGLNYSVQFGVQNLNRYFTLDQLQYLEGLPADLSFEMPSGGTWLKTEARVERITAWKRRLTRKWVHADEWDTDLYDPAE